MHGQRNASLQKVRRAERIGIQLTHHGELHNGKRTQKARIAKTAKGEVWPEGGLTLKTAPK